MFFSPCVPLQSCYSWHEATYENRVKVRAAYACHGTSPLFRATRTLARLSLATHISYYSTRSTTLLNVPRWCAIARAYLISAHSSSQMLRPKVKRGRERKSEQTREQQRKAVGREGGRQRDRDAKYAKGHEDNKTGAVSGRQRTRETPTHAPYVCCTPLVLFVAELSHWLRGTSIHERVRGVTWKSSKYITVPLLPARRSIRMATQSPVIEDFLR